MHNTDPKSGCCCQRSSPVTRCLSDALYSSHPTAKRQHHRGWQHQTVFSPWASFAHFCWSVTSSWVLLLGRLFLPKNVNVCMYVPSKSIGAQEGRGTSMHIWVKSSNSAAKTGKQLHQVCSQLQTFELHPRQQTLWQGKEALTSNYIINKINIVIWAVYCSSLYLSTSWWN